MKAELLRQAAESIGAQVSLRRRQRGLSAAELARLAGLSKATLSAIELGKGNPTVETLYTIAATLRIPVTDLITVQSVAKPELWHRELQHTTEPFQELLQRFDSGQIVEIWNLRLPPKVSLDGVPHAVGTIEYVLVNSGSLYAGPSADPCLLESGDFLSFPAEEPHRYVAENELVDATVIMASHYPSASMPITSS